MAADTTRLLFLAQRAPVFLPGTRQTLKGDHAGKTTDRLTEQQHTNREQSSDWPILIKICWDNGLLRMSAFQQLKTQEIKLMCCLSYDGDHLGVGRFPL